MEDVTDEGEQIRVHARTPNGYAACPDCGTETTRVHGYHQRTVTDVPLDARRVLIVVRIRRLLWGVHEWSWPADEPRGS
nr:transposase family protein [Spongiactinospora rosea]